jgi:hypothetical protein
VSRGIGSGGAFLLGCGCGFSRGVSRALPPSGGRAIHPPPSTGDPCST